MENPKNEEIKKVKWSLNEAAAELKLSNVKIRKVLSSWPLKHEVGNKNKMMLRENTMELLRLYMKTKMYFSYTALIRIRSGTLHVKYDNEPMLDLNEES